MIERPDRLIDEKTGAERNLESLIKDIDRFLSVESQSGQESELRNIIAEKLQGFGYETRVDGKGNLWAESTEKKEGKILFNSHMDRVGSGTVKMDGDKLVGRLDDALGISIIFSLLREGYRPSMLFTVEEESEVEVVVEGESKLQNRELSDGIYNAGARYAVDEIWNGPNKPRLVMTIDVTNLGKPGDGPAIYTSSGLHTPGKQFYFKPGVLRSIADVVNKEHIGTRYVEGNANDSIEFSFIPDLGVTAVEIPIENPHSNNEIADVGDIEKTLKVLRIILENTEQI